MKDSELVQRLTEERAEEDAERALFPDARRAFERLKDAQLLEHTTEAERVRIAEAYTVRYTLFRAGMRSAEPEYWEQAEIWMRDERLCISLDHDEDTSDAESH